MKKALLVIAFLLILAAIPLTVLLVRQRQEIRQRAFPATGLYIQPSTITQNANDQFDVTVMMDTGENYVTAAELNLNFSATYLEAISIRQATALPNVLVSGAVDNTNGTASITVGVSAQNLIGVNGSGKDIAIITFKAKTDTPSPTLIQFAQTTQVSATGEQGDNVNVLNSTQPASVSIGAQTTASPSPTPSATPEGATPTPGTSPSPSPSPSATPGTGGGTASPTPTPTPTPTTSSQVTQIVSPSSGSSTTDQTPTISGTSFPNALMILSINTSPVTSSTFYANSSGNWTYTPTSNITLGTYTITVTGENSTGTLETDTSTLTVASSGTGGGTTATPTPTPSSTPAPSATAGTGGGTTATTTTTSTSSSVPVTGTSLPTFLLLGMAAILLLGGSAAYLTDKKN